MRDRVYLSLKKSLRQAEISQLAAPAFLFIQLSFHLSLTSFGTNILELTVDENQLPIKWAIVAFAVSTGSTVSDLSTITSTTLLAI
jgi:hypothetical protein